MMAKSKAIKIVSWSVLGLLVVAVIVAGIAWQRFTSGLAEYDGTVKAQGVTAKIRIVRDVHAVPHIFADSELDAYLGLGFAQAQDRYWQMVLIKHAVTGRLAELFGPDALDHDYSHRAYNINKYAIKSLTSLPAEDRARLDAYVAGVNAWITSDHYRRPPEFVLLGLEAKSWTALDTMVIGKAASVIFAYPAFKEMETTKFAHKLGAEKTQEFASVYPKDGHIALSFADVEKTMGDALAQWMAEQETYEADASAAPIDSRPAVQQSNSWVVSGDHTASGKPMLAGDPHLPLSLPNQYHLARISYPGNDVAGAFVPGSLASQLGRNRELAYSLTYSARDNYDLRYLTLNPENPDEYLTDAGYREFVKRIETFNIKGGDAKTREYLESHHGPVMPDSLIDATPVYGDGVVISMAWANEYGRADGLSGALRSNRATSVDEWMDAVMQSRSLDRNVAVAHKDGDIGLIIAGSQGKRKAISETSGAIAADGGHSANDWLGVYPEELLPRVINPSSGIIATANGQVVPDEFPVPTSYYYAAPSRQQRIQNLLEARQDHNFESFRAIQMDSYNIDVLRILPTLLSTETDDSGSKAALQYLSSWQGDWRADSPAPVAYLIWFETLANAIAQDELEENPTNDLFFSELFFERVLVDGASHWCDNVTTEDRQETCGELLTTSLEEAVEMLTNHYGPDWSELRFAEMFKVRIPHSGLDAVPVLTDTLARTMVPADGPGISSGPGAPNIGWYDHSKLPEFSTPQIVGASFRFIVDWADPDNAGFILPAGQSGHFKSPYYDDQLQLWKQGEYIKIPFAEAAIDKAYELTLEPLSN